MSDIYTAQVRWEDGVWQATVLELPGAHTYARSMTALRKRLREVIVLMDDRPDSDVEDEAAFTVSLAVEVSVSDTAAATGGGEATLTVSAEGAGQAVPTGSGSGGRTVVGRATGRAGLGGGTSTVTTDRPDQALQLAADLRRRAVEAEADAEHATRIAVLMAQQAGISVRDAAALLGVSYQRVQQIASEAARESSPTAR